MGMSASQARFLELTARKSNIEYEAQRINFERLQLAEKQSLASDRYNEAMSNRKLTFAYNDGEGTRSVDITYNNYKNYINQQQAGLNITQQKMFLVSSSGNKIIVANEKDMKDIIDSNKTEYKATSEEIKAAKEELALAEKEGRTVSPRIKALASIELSEDGIPTGDNVVAETDAKTGETVYKITVNNFTPEDFFIVPDLENADNFQKAISEGIYFFATYGVQEGEDEARFRTYSVDEMSFVYSEYDKSDDAQAQAEYDKITNEVQVMDKKLELKLQQLETERDAIKTEMDSVQKVIEDNISSTFKAFS